MRFARIADLIPNPDPAIPTELKGDLTTIMNYVSGISLFVAAAALVVAGAKLAWAYRNPHQGSGNALQTVGAPLVAVIIITSAVPLINSFI